MRTAVTSLAVALILAAVAAPAAPLCCSAMPCCSISAPQTTTAQQATITAPAVVAVMAGAIELPAVATRVQQHERVTNDLAAPPPFLLHRQFRI